jgi:MoaA/NifB/PqqE/SkfB family radical SAM enzyme
MSKTSSTSDTSHTEDRRPRLSFPSGWRLIPVALHYVGSMLWYSLHPQKYPLFSLRSLLTLKRKKLVGIRRIARLGKHCYGTTMRIPRWPSPAFDRMVANGGLNVESGLIARKRHIDTAILGITRRCLYSCEHCYDASNRHTEDIVPVGRWIETVQQLQQIGVSVIVLSGGEPFLRYSALLDILANADLNLSDFHVHTSGFDVTRQRAEELAERGLVAAGIGLDYPDEERQDRFRGISGAFQHAVHSLEAFTEAGVFTYTNLCLQKDLISNGGLYVYLDLARRLEVGSIQLLEPKPCGKYTRRAVEGLFSDVERDRVMKFFVDANQSKRFRKCPPVAYTAYYERPENFGCLMGGLSHLSIDSNGDVNPCVFVPVSFGNILEENFGTVYRRMQKVITQPLHDTCASVQLSQLIAQYREQTGDHVVPFEGFSEQWKAAFSHPAEAAHGTRQGL